MSEARAAATVMVVRDGAEDIELILLKRSRKVGFFPSAWVFPGGRVDEEDSKFPSTGSVPGLEDTCFAVAAIRETFEEAGYWLGEGRPSSKLREVLNKREGSLPLDGSLVANLSRLRQWSWWITPETEPRRYDTRFFLCCVNESEQEISHDNYEAVESCWISPREAIRKHEQGEMFMAPPTYITLLELQRYSSCDQLWNAAESKQIEAIQPTHFREESLFEIRFPGHPKHPVSTKILEYTHVILEQQVWRACSI